MFLRILSYTFVFFLLSTQVAVGQEAVAEAPGISEVVQKVIEGGPAWIGLALTIALGLSVFLRGASEALYIIAKKTKTDSDDKAALLMGRTAEILAKCLGMVGIGMPKPMVIQKAEKLGMVTPDDPGKTGTNNNG